MSTRDVKVRLSLEDKVSAGLDRMGKQLDTVGDKMINAGNTMQAAGRGLIRNITLPILGAGGAALKMSADFETSMSKVVGLVGIAQEQVDEWGKDILEMAPRVAKAPKELADALFFITSAGIKGAEALDVLELSAKASAAGLGETKVIADLVTSVVNAYGSETMDAALATDILVTAVREGKAEAPEFAGALGQVLPIASEMGVQFGEVAGVIAAMTRTGTDAANASTQLKNILASLIKPSVGAEKALRDMGTTSEELRRQIGDEGLFPTLMNLKDLTNEYGEEMMAQVFPNIRALMGILDLMGANMEDNAAIMEAMLDPLGALEHGFDTAADTMEHKWNAAIAGGQSALILLGDAVKVTAIPLIERLTEKIQEGVKWWSALDEETQQMYIRWAGMAAAAGPALLVLGKFVTVSGQVVKGAGFMIGKFATMGAAGGPVAAAVITLGAIAGVMLLSYQHSEDFRESAKKLTGRLSELGDKMKGDLSEAFNNLDGDIRGIDGMFGSLGDTLARVIGLVDRGVGLFEKLWDTFSLADVVAGHIDKIITNLDGLIGMLEGLIGVYDAISKLDWEALVEAIKTGLDGLVSYLSTTWPGRILMWLGENFSDFSKVSFDGGVEMGQSLSGALNGMSPQIYEAGESLSSEAADGMGSETKAAKEAGVAMADGMKVGLESRLKKIRDAGVNMVRIIVGAARLAAETSSPSKATMRIGADIAEGLAVGMENKSERAFGAGRDLTRASLAGAKREGDTVKSITTHNSNKQNTNNFNFNISVTGEGATAETVRATKRMIQEEIMPAMDRLFGRETVAMGGV